MKSALKIDQVADRLGSSPSTVYKLIRAGQFPGPFYIGRSSRWSSDDVDRYLTKKEAERGAPA